MNFGGPDDLTFSHPVPVAVVGGRYELRLLLGSGGMAEVHLAHDVRLDRLVAVKTLRADLAHDPVFQERFRREAQSTASLNHPAIAAVYDTGEDASMPYGGGWEGAGFPLPYLVMEYVDGTTLRESLYSGPPLTVERALSLTADVLRALAHSHQQGIVHRDIKPANVMLTRAGRVKVMDFGIARDARDTGMTQTSVVIGTAQYLSPEQALGQDIDARSDLYSVGCLLYELLTFRTPFTGETPIAVMYQHIQEAPHPPSLYNPEIGPDVDAIVLRALQKDPWYRYQSATEMLGDIEAQLSARPSAAGAAPRTEGTGDSFDGDDSHGGEEEPGRRRGSVALVVAGVAVLVAALVVGWFMFGRGAADDGKVTVPVLVGRTLDEARNAADNVGLTVTVAKRESCADQPTGHVCTQSPADGELDKGQAVSVTVSTGAPKVEVPDVVDKDEDDASRILEDKGFKVKVRHVESSEDPGTVLKQDPEGGDKVEKGTEVTLAVAKEAEKSTVPDLTGNTASEARNLLAEHDLKLGDTTEVDSGAEAGTVVGQSVPSGEEVEPGSTVDVQVAKAVETVQIPTDIVGRTLAEVQDELGGLGLQVSVASGYSQASDAVVASSTPVAGSEVEAGSTVIVVTEDTSDESSDNGTPAGDTATAPTTATSSSADGGQ
ncbi:Stk1 family PASTA domain-containing Ser/Thr kinase [Streptomyces sp. NBC_00038]|uniref:Stk1 family PASTA domain-containing Ser/Thr kinase n=1 Tax=Streptomyces sp. NBC_00038 TaxID=2903615 RepID=UPI00224E739A|nr:Stk1 family PASTA domain-containing Ser/Thr kinase [Streptomyces sp. NBC_00038]MCX5556512.1 Stk1 family PASTA domain-containing Ser/Thr kinase [Streptomyces sp. NBC_00038]